MMYTINGYPLMTKEEYRATIARLAAESALRQALNISSLEPMPILDEKKRLAACVKALEILNSDD